LQARSGGPIVAVVVTIDTKGQGWERPLHSGISYSGSEKETRVEVKKISQKREERRGACAD